MLSLVKTGTLLLAIYIKRAYATLGFNILRCRSCLRVGTLHDLRPYTTLECALSMRDITLALLLPVPSW